MATFCRIFFSNAQGRQLPGQLFILVWSEITCLVRPTEHLYPKVDHDSMCAFHSTKISVWNFGNSTCPMERYILVAQTWPKPPRAWLLFLQAGYKRAVLGTTILSNGKEHFGPTDWNGQTGQRGPPSKLFPNIPVGPNRNGLFRLM